MTDAERPGEATLGDPRPETYVIETAEKDRDDWWVIVARIKFNEADVKLPVRVRVVWAGDTPVITVDDFQFPGMGKYAARVMIYRGYYCGTRTGDPVGACNELTKWVYAGGRKVRGLERRREAERTLCLKGAA